MPAPSDARNVSTPDLGKKRDRKRLSREAHRAVSAKIGHLRSEGMDEDQAVATALNMAHEGQLGPRGGYHKR